MVTGEQVEFGAGFSLEVTVFAIDAEDGAGIGAGDENGDLVK